VATFRKHEHLKSRRIIDELMKKGASVTMQPLKLIWMEAPLETKVPAQVAFGVSKKNFPLAVDRNRIKRQMRECYREHKNKLYDFLNASGKQYAIMLVFTSKKQPSFNELMLKYAVTLQRLEKDIKQDSKQHNDSAD